MEYLLPCVQTFRSLESTLSTSPQSMEQVDRGMEVHQLYNFIQNTRKEHNSCKDFQVVLLVNNTPANTGEVRDVSLILGLGRTPGGGQGNLL